MLSKDIHRKMHLSVKTMTTIRTLDHDKALCDALPFNEITLKLEDNPLFPFYYRLQIFW